MVPLSRELLPEARGFQSDRHIGLLSGNRPVSEFTKSPWTNSPWAMALCYSIYGDLRLCHGMVIDIDLCQSTIVDGDLKGWIWDFMDVFTVWFCWQSCCSTTVSEVLWQIHLWLYGVINQQTKNAWRRGPCRVLVNFLIHVSIYLYIYIVVCMYVYTVCIYI